MSKTALLRLILNIDPNDTKPISLTEILQSPDSRERLITGLSSVERDIRMLRRTLNTATRDYENI